jgi:hypothetical protein
VDDSDGRPLPYPEPHPEKDIPNKYRGVIRDSKTHYPYGPQQSRYRKGKDGLAFIAQYKHDTLPRAPSRAIRFKGQQLVDATYNKDIDWHDLFARYVDLWQESRMVLWRSKHSKPGLEIWDEKEKRMVRTFTSDDRMVLDAVVVIKSVLDSMVRLRKDMIGPDGGSGIPRWAIDRINEALQAHPEALEALIEALAHGET